MSVCYSYTIMLIEFYNKNATDDLKKKCSKTAVPNIFVPVLYMKMFLQTG